MNLGFWFFFICFVFFIIEEIIFCCSSVHKLLTKTHKNFQKPIKEKHVTFILRTPFKKKYDDNEDKSKDKKRPIILEDMKKNHGGNKLNFEIKFDLNLLKK